MMRQVHLQIDDASSSSPPPSCADGGSGGLDDATTTPPSAIAEEGTPLLLRRRPPSSDDDDDDDDDDDGSGRRRKTGRGGGGGGDASTLRTSVNVAKFCMGTGTLALPFASEKGGLIFNAIGLFVIGAWDYYMSILLLGCIDLLPVSGGEDNDDGGMLVEVGGVGGARHRPPPPVPPPPPPPGTTAYGRVAWYALGPVGLTVLDALMLSLLFGLVVAYESAMMSFVDGTPLSTGSGGLDLLMPNSIVIVLSCAPDVGWLGNFSGIGLMALAASFAIISWQGFAENGFGGFWDASSALGLWPASLSAASSWFGVAVFSYGVAPFVFNFRDSMKNPRHVGHAVRTGLLLVFVGYVAMSNGIRVLFSPSHVFDGDVLQAMPDSWISLSVRLLMTFVVALTTPLVVVPCGELIEGKLGMAADDEDDGRQQRRSKLAPERVVVRVAICLSCMAFSGYVPNGFVDLVSFIGCFCGATTGFVLPPLFRLKLSSKGKPWSRGSMDRERLSDVVALVLAVMATSIASVLTLRELIGKVTTK